MVQGRYAQGGHVHRNAVAVMVAGAVESAGGRRGTGACLMGASGGGDTSLLE